MIQVKKLLLIHLMLACVSYVCGQTKIAITIDDVPNTRKYEKDNFKSDLLNKLDSLNVPVSIFINEGLVYKTQHLSKNRKLLRNWLQRDYITIGNHTSDHTRLSEVSVDSFMVDVVKGEHLTKNLKNRYGKSLRYFRFPYNDLGKDSIQQQRIKEELTKRDYIITPFTIESSDWVFNYLYEHYLNKGDHLKAENIAKVYIEKSLEYCSFFDSLSVDLYGRNINQIYLCHDNTINADYLHILINKLKERGYVIVSLEEAMKDEVYKSENQYYKKWGISWIYRWMENKKLRKKLMHEEPDIMEVYQEYQQLKNQ